MSTLIVDYNQYDSLVSTAKSMSKKISSRISDYSNIKSKMGNISTSRSNISQANYFIQKKNDMLQEKKDKIDAFEVKVTNFNTEAKSADKRVANRINSDIAALKKSKEISVSVFTYIEVGLEDLAKSWFGRDTLNSIKEFARNAKYTIKDWYHDAGGKYILNIALDVVLLALAVAVMVVFPPATILAAVFAGFAVYNSVSSIGYDIMALNNFNKTGNRSTADAIDDKGGENTTRFVFGETAGLLKGDKEFWSDVGGVVHTGMSIAGLAYTLKGDYKNFQKSFAGFKKVDGAFISKFGKNFFKPASEVSMSGIYRVQSIAQKVIPSFSTNSAQKVAETAWIYKNYKVYDRLTGYINIVDNDLSLDGVKGKVQVPSTLNDVWEKGGNLIKSFGGFSDNNATRIPKIKGLSNFKIPSMNVI